ncbi:MAG: hypothetical protein ACKOQZ_06775, partial [Actinomycetota bacterium]
MNFWKKLPTRQRQGFRRSGIHHRPERSDHSYLRVEQQLEGKALFRAPGPQAPGLGRVVGEERELGPH